MRSYDRTTYLGARRAWDDGRFGSEWDELRRLSWERGFPYPPDGSVHDAYTDDPPSQRAVIYQWLDWQPTETRRIVASSHSWSQVVDRLIGLRKRLEEDADYTDREAEAEREERPSYRESVSSLASILARIGDSR